jgi:hypothetical protein
MNTKFIPQAILDRITWAEGDLLKIAFLEQQPKPCEACGETVCDRRVQIKQHVSPKPHTRTKCITCNRFLNPETGEFDIDASDAVAFFRSAFAKSDK